MAYSPLTTQVRASSTPRRVSLRGLAVPALLSACALLYPLTIPIPVGAQYFGRNKVQYDDFDFQILQTPHFDIYFYSEMDPAIRDVSRMAERWYERLARLFQHEFLDPKPLIFYADHPDFQQTNTVSSQLSEGVGGVTESLKNRVIMPLSGSYASTDHVLGHELVHAFQYNLAQSRRGGGLQGLMQVPLWMIEGMAEYFSVGAEDPLTAMWLRDAVLRDDFPTLRQMTRESRFFPYRFGQAFWTYVGGTYGDERAVSLLRTAMRIGWEPAIEVTLGLSSDSLSARWREVAEAHYRPLMEGKTPPGEVGTLLLSPSTGAGHQNVSPAVSPDGRRMVVMSEKDLFTFDLYLADARTGEIIRTLHSAAADPHMDALRFIDSSGSWSPDGSRIALVAFAQGRNEIVILDGERGEVRDRLPLSPNIGEVTGPTWSPDGRTIVFSGQVGGLTDLFSVDVESREIRRLTQDRHSAFQPVFSPDGGTVAFVSDRGAETDFETLTYSRERLTLLDVESGEIEVLDIFGDVRHTNPQFSPDGQSLYFISDPDGFSDIYRVELNGEATHRVTEIATAVTGITGRSPAMSVARETGTVVFSVFDEFQFHVYSMDSREAPESPIVAESSNRAGRLLPPADPPIPSRVAAYLADPLTALAPPDSFQPEEAEGYQPSLSLDYIGQPQLGAGTNRWGEGIVGGSAAAFFSDMLGNRQLGAALWAQGTLKDLGGEFLYQNRENRWDWGVSAGRIPYLQMRLATGSDSSTGEQIYQQDRLRIFETQGAGLASYPFSSTQRLEFRGGVTRLSFDLERETYRFNDAGQLVSRDREAVTEGLPDPLNLFQSSIALVGDNSFFGLSSPVRGTRYRIEVGQTVGTVNFRRFTLDFRRYFNPVTELTIAFRGMHQGRYGSEIHGSDVLQPMFLGWETLVRGYSAFSFDQSLECTPSLEFGQCPEFERLFGHRVAVANVEVRVPLLGVDRFGLFDFGFLPIEMVLFTDAGLAWDEERAPVFEVTRNSLQRIPVFSSGASARVNLMGMMVMEIYYAHPWQRPRSGGHWGFQIAPGW